MYPSAVWHGQRDIEFYKIHTYVHISIQVTDRPFKQTPSKYENWREKKNTATVVASAAAAVPATAMPSIENKWMFIDSGHLFKINYENVNFFPSHRFAFGAVRCASALFHCIHNFPWDFFSVHLWNSNWICLCVCVHRCDKNKRTWHFGLGQRCVCQFKRYGLFFGFVTKDERNTTKFDSVVRFLSSLFSFWSHHMYVFIF